MKAKLKDVAALAGVAPNTASTILNRRSNSWASKETEQRVFEAAKKLDYTPSRAALALRLGRSKTIGLVIPDLHNPFFTTLADLMEHRLRAAGYEMILEQVRTGQSTGQTGILERQVDGVVYVYSDMQLEQAALKNSMCKGKAIVCLTSRRASPAEVDTVLVDFSEGLSDAVDHLCALGHRSFVFLSALAKGQHGGERQRLFEDLLHRRGILADKIDCVNCDQDWQSAHAAFAAFLQSRKGQPLPTALVAINDLSAIAAMRAAYEAGLRVPEDLSVIGVDDIQLGAYLPRQLTTIGQPLAQMAAATIELLLARLEPTEGTAPSASPAAAPARSSTAPASLSTDSASLATAPASPSTDPASPSTDPVAPAVPAAPQCREFAVTFISRETTARANTQPPVG